MDNSLNPIEDFITTGLAEHLFKVFRVPFLFYNGPDVKAVANKRLKKQGPALYPFARVRTSGFALNETSYKPNTLLRRGLHGQASHDNTRTYKLSMIPVITTYEVEFYVQDMRSLRNLSKQWLISATRGNLKYTINYGIGPIDIDIKLDKQLSVPPREGGVSEIKEYVLVASLMVNGYMSENGLTSSQAVNQLDYEGQVRLLNESEGAQVFLFHNKWNERTGAVASVDDQIETGS